MNDVEEFSLSVKAQNVQAQFYGKKAVVYVEGGDDVIFWSSYFDVNQCELIQVNGSNNINKKIDSILHEGLLCIVACDSDYSYYDGNHIEHPLIVRTLSHSIECIMYCPININECIKKCVGV